MEKKFINPSTLFDSTPFGFTQVAVSQGKRTIYCAGQTAWDANRNLIGGSDLGAQLRASFHNVGLALDAVGATPADVVQMRVYIVNHKPENLDVLIREIRAFYGAGRAPANSIVGVQALALPEFLCEIEVTAVVD